MGRLVAIEFLTVDGVMQGLGSKEEDTEGGFVHGGWGARFAESIHQVVGSAGLSQTTAYLFGRRTYDKMAVFWPHQPDSDPMAAHLNAVPKYVVSRTLGQGDWANTHVLAGSPTDEVRDLKGSVEGDIALLGSGQLFRTLLAASLVDELRMFLHPLLLGTGKRLFGDLPDPCDLSLQTVAKTDLGTVALSYRPVRVSAPGPDPLLSSRRGVG